MAGLSTRLVLAEDFHLLSLAQGRTGLDPPSLNGRAKAAVCCGLLLLVDSSDVIFLALCKFS